MGLAASQCRLLLLTARLSDTEYRAQMISQRRMALAMQTEQIATEYSRKMNNRQLRLVFDLKADDNSTFNEILTYARLCAKNKDVIGTFRVVTADGKIAVPSVDSIPATIYTTEKDGKTYGAVVNQAFVASALSAHIADMIKKDPLADVSGLTALLADKDNWSKDQLLEAYSIIKAAGLVDESTLKEITSNTVFKTDDGNEYIVMPGLNNTDWFQNALRTGVLYAEKLEKNGNDVASWNMYDLLHSDIIEDNLYTADDPAAAAEYEVKSAMIQAQDKQLELELKQVETQHQAAQTEYDSVKKVIEKNIERSFKTFG